MTKCTMCDDAALVRHGDRSAGEGMGGDRFFEDFECTREAIVLIVVSGGQGTKGMGKRTCQSQNGLPENLKLSGL